VLCSWFLQTSAWAVRPPSLPNRIRVREIKDLEWWWLIWVTEEKTEDHHHHESSGSRVLGKILWSFKSCFWKWDSLEPQKLVCGCNTEALCINMDSQKHLKTGILSCNIQQIYDLFAFVNVFFSGVTHVIWYEDAPNNPIPFINSSWQQPSSNVFSTCPLNVLSPQFWWCLWLNLLSQICSNLCWVLQLLPSLLTTNKHLVALYFGLLPLPRTPQH
jgi:hypothetical protein